MKPAILLVVVSAVSILCRAQQSSKPDGPNKPVQGTPAMCEAAAQKMRDAGTDQVILMITISAQGHVLSFKTETPKGLRLEKMKKPAHEIEAMRFDPATKDGKPVMVMIRAAFQCP